MEREVKRESEEKEEERIKDEDRFVVRRMTGRGYKMDREDGGGREEELTK